MEIFKQHPSVFQGPASRRVIHMYNRVSQVLLEYEMLYHSAWLKTISVVDEGLSEIMLSLCKTLVRPHVEYCSSAWSTLYKKDKELIENIQHRFTKMTKNMEGKSCEDRLIYR